MANVSNVGIITTANTFDNWRIRDNLVANDVNEISRGNFSKPAGNVTITEGRLVLANTTGGTILEVKDDARVDGTVSVRNIEEDAAGYVYLSGGDITMGNRAAGGLFQANINTFFNSANVTVSNVTVGGTFNVASNTTITATNVSITNTTTGTLNIGNRIVTISTPNVLISNTDTTARFNVYPITHFFGGLVNVANTDGSATFNVTPNTFMFASANISGNVNVGSKLEVLGNTFLYSNVAVSNNATVSWNITSGNVSVSQNTSTGNLVISQNTSTGNVTISQNASTGNLVVSQNSSTGNLVISQNSSTGNLSVATLANVALGNVLTLFVQDLTVKNPIAAPAETTGSEYRLRVQQASRADGYFGVNLGSSANGNAWIRFDTSAGNVWRETANSTEGTYYTILSVRNLVTTTACTSTIDVISANTVNTLNTLISTTSSTQNAVFGTINSTFSTVNTTFGTLNTTFGTLNTTFGTVNTAITNAHNQANTARSDANTTFATMNGTFATINATFGTTNTSISTKFNTSGGTITGDLTVNGNTSVVLKSYKEFAVVNTNVNGANTVDLSTANFFQYTLTGNPTFTFRNAPTSNNMTFNMVLIQDGAGNRVISWANTVYWAGGQVPPATTTAGARDVWQFITYDGGSTYIGTLAVKDAR